MLGIGKAIRKPLEHCFWCQKYHVGHDAGTGDFQHTIRRRVAISGAGSTAGVHHVDAVFIGASGFVGVSVECNIAAVFQSLLFQIVQRGVDTLRFAYH